MNTLEIFELIKKNTNAVISFHEEDGPTPSIYVRSDFILEVMKFLFENQDTDFKVLMNQTGFHETEDAKLFWHSFFDVSMEESEEHEHEELRLFWNLYSYTQKHRVTIESSVPVGKPDVESVTSIWSAADWLERETYDLLGVNFTGHPDLRRLMMPEDWEGHPLRKDYVSPISYNGIDNSLSDISESFRPKGKKT